MADNLRKDKISNWSVESHATANEACDIQYFTLVSRLIFTMVNRYAHGNATSTFEGAEGFDW